MKNYLLALVLLFGVVGCAETPDDFVSEDLEVITQATQAWLLPRTLSVRARNVSTTNVTWTFSAEIFTKLFDDLNTKRGYYLYGSNGIGPTLTTTTNAASCTNAGTTFFCTNLNVACPTVNFNNDPVGNYFDANNGVYTPGWYYSPPFVISWHVFSPSNTLSANPNPTSAKLTGSPGSWMLHCYYPKPSEYYILQG